MMGSKMEMINAKLMPMIFEGGAVWLHNGLVWLLPWVCSAYHHWNVLHINAQISVCIHSGRPFFRKRISELEKKAAPLSKPLAAATMHDLFFFRKSDANHTAYVHSQIQS